MPDPVIVTTAYSRTEPLPIDELLAVAERDLVTCDGVGKQRKAAILAELRARLDAGTPREAAAPEWVRRTTCCGLALLYSEQAGDSACQACETHYPLRDMVPADTRSAGTVPPPDSVRLATLLEAVEGLARYGEGCDGVYPTESGNLLDRDAVLALIDAALHSAETPTDGR